MLGPAQRNAERGSRNSRKICLSLRTSPLVPPFLLVPETPPAEAAKAVAAVEVAWHEDPTVTTT